MAASKIGIPMSVHKVAQTLPSMRAALYMRVSTGRQAEHDLSIPDQRHQLHSWCRANGYEPAAEFVEAGASATIGDRSFSK
jgi:DNA invertase Pin-like site-specific DNA recombinase